MVTKDVCNKHQLTRGQTDGAALPTMELLRVFLYTVPCKLSINLLLHFASLQPQQYFIGILKGISLFQPGPYILDIFMFFHSP